MLKKKLKQFFIVIFCIIFAIMVSATGIVSTDILHTSHCEIHDCPVCSLINMSMIFAKNINYIRINVIMLLITTHLVQLINYNVQKKKKNSLVELKVILIN